MRKLTALLGLLFFAGSVSAATLTGTIRLASGSKFNGKIRMTLSHPAHDTSNDSLVVPQTVEFRVRNGALPSNAAVAGNDVLEPLYTYYWTEYFTEAGLKVMENPFYVAGGSFDLGAARPTTITTSNISFVGVPTTGSCPYGEYATATTTSGVTCSATVMPSTFLTGSGTLDFSETSAQSSADLTITVTGAAVGDTVALGIPASPPSNSCFTAFVSATNTVTVRFNNYSSGALDPASGTFKVTVIK
jgi:hypothetical protein